jgi:hypothetical protein
MEGFQLILAPVLVSLDFDKDINSHCSGSDEKEQGRQQNKVG